MPDALQLPVVDLCSPDRFSTADSIRQACIDHGFFYLVNHGVDEELQSYFAFPIPSWFRVKRDLRAQIDHFRLLDKTGDSREGFYIGPLADDLNQWPLEEDLPSWRSTMETYFQKLQSVGTKLLSLIALSLILDEDFFEKLGALNDPSAIIGLLHYPGDLDSSSEDIHGASAHSDFGMITLLATDGVPGLQICREKNEKPQVWEDVPSMSGAFIVNIGDVMERWTNCLFRSTVHKVLPPGQERYSVAFFANPNKDCLIECFESCCSESCPPRFPPIKYLDYMQERLRVSFDL
ncbi:putative 40S ribosomal protein S7 [Hibiscus syriacus]|uniref:40S ribosomal protein S7 n=1 Tax=Hibiscus syriacus TaxID=106335 RepID=A0A6A2XSN0_HIBSY|nr:putative 40S ribosomal protein S7 [Hibiscus syriacus]